MTLAQAEERLAHIIAIRGDDEAAHIEEDRFHREVLRAIAAGSKSPAALATIALRTSNIEFSRWCA